MYQNQISIYIKV